MAPKPKVGKFARRTHAGRKHADKIADVFISKLGELATKKAEAKKRSKVLPMVYVTVRQPAPYKPLAYKK